MKKKVTIQTIAERAGVSRGTVDRVLHNRAYVNESVRRQVLQAIRELKYVPIHGADATAEAFQVLRLGIIIPTWSDFFNQEIPRGIREAEAEFGPAGLEVLSRTCASDLPSEVLQAIDELLDAGVQGLAIAAQDSALLSAKLNQLAAQGVPVILYNADFPDCRRLLYVGPDVRRSGRVAGELMHKMVAPDAQLLVALGSQEIFSQRERMLGFVEHLTSRGFASNQIKTVNTYNDYVSFQRIAGELTQNPRIQGIYLANDTVTGCVEALDSLGLAGRVHVICHDLTDHSRRYLLDHTVDFVIDQEIHMESYLALQLLREHLLAPDLPLSCDAFSSIPILCAENLPAAGV